MTTKFFIPSTRPERVRRPRLVDHLNAGLYKNQGFARKLTLISAPAGFGKTTLVSDWLDDIRSKAENADQTAFRIAWLSLDESDNDPARFLTYFIGALNRVMGGDSSFGKGALDMLQSPQPPPPESVLISLINEIAVIPDKIVHVLDDYHLIDAQPIHDALLFFLEHLPPQMHLLIATREDPYLPLGRLRARSQMVELRALDLRFTSAEASEFLNQVMGLDLPDELITALETRTEGWIAGLQLAAISMQGREDAVGFIQSFTGSHRFVLDYLIEEVLEQQPQNIQTFLLQTAVLDRLSGSLCDALRFEDTGTSGGREDSQAILERLEHANLFIVPLDEERRWYRYHHLFADLLLQRLIQMQPEKISVLHRNASVWYEENAYPDEAVEHALRAGDHERAADLIESSIDSYWRRGEDKKLQRWLGILPEELLLSRPVLCVFHAWILLASGQLDAAERCLQAAEIELETWPDSESEAARGLTKKSIEGRIATTRAFSAFYHGDAQENTQYAARALEYLPEQDLYWRGIAMHILGDGYDLAGDLENAYHYRLAAVEASRKAGNPYLILFAGLKQVITLRHQGKLMQAMEISRQLMEMAEKYGLSHTIAAGLALAVWGEALAEVNDLEEGLQRARKGVELTGRGLDLVMIGWSRICLTRVLFTMGDLSGAEETINKIEESVQGTFAPPWILVLKGIWQARIWLAQGKLEAASQWAAMRELDSEADTILHREAEKIVMARVLINQERWEDAANLLGCLLEQAEAGKRTARVIEIGMLLALVHQGMGSKDQAMAALEHTLNLAKPLGFIHLFVDEGQPMERLLYEASQSVMTPDYIRQLQAAFPLPEKRQVVKTQKQAPPSELIEPLSDREIEVLGLIAEGLTNQVIATRLYISLNTVKGHTRNIFGKLGVNNRTQAVARARTLGILPSG